MSIFGQKNELNKVAERLRKEKDSAFFEEYKALCDKHGRQVIAFLDISANGIVPKTIIGEYKVVETDKL